MRVWHSQPLPSFPYSYSAFYIIGLLDRIFIMRFLKNILIVLEKGELSGSACVCMHICVVIGIQLLFIFLSKT